MFREGRTLSWLLLVVILLGLSTAAVADGGQGQEQHDHRVGEAQYELTAADRNALRNKVAEMFDHGFSSYMTYAFPDDELKPISCAGRRRGRDASRGEMDNVLGGYALTLVDSLDSLAVFGRKNDFASAVQYIAQNVSFDKDVLVNVFEVTIRVLGGLISGHLLAEDRALGLMEPNRSTHFTYRGELLSLAQDLGDRLLLAFNSPTGIPYSLVNLKRGLVNIPTAETCLAGAGTLQLEFAALSLLSGQPKYLKAALQTVRALWSRRSPHNLLGGLIDVNSGQWKQGIASVGAGSDSFYEYLLKLYILLGEEEFLTMWDQSYAAIRKYMEADGWFLPVNMFNGDTISTGIDALMAFLPAVQVLAGDVHGAAEHHLNFYRLWLRYGLLPENFDVKSLVPRPGANHGYPLRPEFVESTYFLYRATRNPYYLQVGKSVIESIDRLARTKCGFAAVENVALSPLPLEDRMDTFFLSETLKYLYLLFDEDNFVHKEDYIFTTEALHLGVWREQQQCSLTHPLLPRLPPPSELILRPTHAQTPPAPPAQQQPAFQFTITDPKTISIAHQAGEAPGAVSHFVVNDQILIHLPRGASVLAAPALFGPQLEDTCLDFAAATVEPFDACERPNRDFTGMIAVAQRGTCNFVTKILNAQSAGALGVVICDVFDQNVLPSMSASAEEGAAVLIPAVLISKPSCALLLSTLQAGDHLRVERSIVPFSVQLPVLPGHGVLLPGARGPDVHLHVNSFITAFVGSLARFPQLQAQLSAGATVQFDPNSAVASPSAALLPPSPPSPSDECQPLPAPSLATSPAPDYLVAPPFPSSAPPETPPPPVSSSVLDLSLPAEEALEATEHRENRRRSSHNPAQELSSLLPSSSSPPPAMAIAAADEEQKKEGNK